MKSQRRTGGPLDPSENEHCIGKKEKDILKSEESLPCVREEKANILFGENMKQREEPEKDGGPLDPSKNEHCIGKKEKDILKSEESLPCVREEKTNILFGENMKQREEPEKDGGSS